MFKLICFWWKIDIFFRINILEPFKSLTNQIPPTTLTLVFVSMIYFMFDISFFKSLIPLSYFFTAFWVFFNSSSRHSFSVVVYFSFSINDIDWVSRFIRFFVRSSIFSFSFSISLVRTSFWWDKLFFYCFRSFKWRFYYSQ